MKINAGEMFVWKLAWLSFSNTLRNLDIQESRVQKSLEGTHWDPTEGA